jgi:transcriptional regulator with XRE-family HTH domain
LLTPGTVSIYVLPLQQLRALVLLRQNIEAMLFARKESQAALATALGHSRAWINKFLNGERQLQLKDLDRIADFFGVPTYQLFQPGMSRLNERRVVERRSGRDRRVGHAHRALGAVAADLDRVRGRGGAPRYDPTPAPPPAPDPVRTLVAEFATRIAPLLAADLGRQTADSRGAGAAGSAPVRSPGRRAPKPA